ncbi:DctP family TRAP transporter solute-binding subunit [Candidatus Halobeggiatoa sp. HSG11]|nr:DctP family TRAP transporter solute-binding subunit [Candidatus Halobeggiatoa sp. HSG11]
MKLLMKVLVLSLLAIFANVQAEYVIKFSHVVAPKTPKGQAADLFAKLVNERLAGKVKVEVFPNSQLFNDNKVMEAIRMSSSTKTGIIAAPSLSKFVKFSRTIQAFDLPFLFNGIDDVHKLADSPVASDITKPLERKGLKALGFWDSGMKAFSIKAESALRKIPDDFKGKKFRIQTSNVHEAMIHALGGNPQKLPFKEVYTALGQGVVDGQENSWSNIYSKKFHEVQDWITVTNHAYLGYLLIVSNDFWNGLPSEIRIELEKIIKEVTIKNREFAAAADAADRQAIEKSGFAKVVELTEEERKTWVEATKQVEEKFAKQIGKNLLIKIHQTLGH